MKSNDGLYYKINLHLHNSATEYKLNPFKDFYFSSKHQSFFVGIFLFISQGFFFSFSCSKKIVNEKLHFVLFYFISKIPHYNDEKVSSLRRKERKSSFLPLKNFGNCEKCIAIFNDKLESFDLIYFKSFKNYDFQQLKIVFQNVSK